jgi:TonB-dependent starch-binding outer membrane protein SusC
MGGHYINDGPTNKGVSRSIRWPTCADYYELADNGNRDQATAERATSATPILSARNDALESGLLQAPRRDAAVPLGELIPRSSNSTLTLSGQNWYRWRNADFPIFDPEMVSNTGFNDQNPAITEHIPPPATFIASLRIDF